MQTATGRMPLADDESALWQRWHDCRDAGARSQLLAMHLPYAKTVARVYYGRRRHDEIGFDDYLQLARVGMLESFERFEPSRDASFRTFASHRMHGSILDGLASATEKQQQIAIRRALAREAIEREACRGRSRWRSGERLFRALATSGIGNAVCQMLQDTGMVERGDSERTDDELQLRTIEHAQLKARLLEALDGLAPQQRTVIRQHYLHEHSFEDVAATLRVTRGRISQIHRAALDVLREQLSAV